jgi:hypothetical protein
MSYLIKTYFDVYEDDYNEGEGKHMTSWSWESEHDAIESALQQHFEQVGLSYDAQYLYDEDNIRSYSWTVDEDCCELTEKGIEHYRQGKKQLYSMHASINVYKLEEI